jgi:hypothetical protein
MLHGGLDLSRGDDPRPRLRSRLPPQPPGWSSSVGSASHDARRPAPAEALNRLIGLPRPVLGGW